ncbi:MAG: ATP-binding protein [Haloplanus sp.]
MNETPPTWTIGLSIAHDRNRELLASRLSEEYEVVTATPDADPDDTDVSDAPSVDLWMVDGRSLAPHRDALADLKADARPVFLPVLLLASDDVLDRLPPTDESVVDEFHTTPVRPTALRRRVDNLLQRRRLSLDLDERRERNRERFRTLFEAAPDPVVVTDADGTLTELNPACLRQFDVDRTATGDSVETLVDDSPPGLPGLFTRADATTWSDTVSWNLDDGRPLVTDIHFGVLGSDPTNDRVGILRDVTEKHRRSERLQRQNDRLQSFASTVSHDLRNPLNVAQGHLGRLDGDESLDEVVAALDRMEELVEEVLTLARHGELVLDAQPLSLDAVASDAWSHVATGEATLEMASDCTVRADRERLVALFENLFRNAVEHGSTGSQTRSDDAVERKPASDSPRDAPTVRVGTLDDGFYVADDGPGIPPSDRERVFESGYTDHDDGTGFGLAIVSQVVDAHDWYVSITGSDDGGARFEVRDVEFADADDTTSAAAP